MKKHHMIIYFFLFACAGKMSAQQLTPFVVSPSGGFYSNDSGMLSFTVGEMAAVTTLATSTAILTQGFQQYWDLGTPTIEHPHIAFSSEIHPNPSDGNFTLVTETTETANVDVRIMDLLGREIFRTSYHYESTIHTQHFNLTDLPQGCYLVHLTVKDDYTSITNYQVQKIQIIK
jgi:hypothetical protein